MTKLKRLKESMKKKFNDIEINFRVQKNANADRFVLLLHGWGGGLNSFRGLEEYLINNNYSVINMDFPGFGNSENPKQNFVLDDYVLIVKQMLEFLNVDSIMIVAHSFGGRVAIKLASQSTMVKKLVLVDSAGVKPRFNLTNYFKVKRYKILKFLVSKKIIKKDLSKMGSQDYVAMPSELKSVFVKIINEDLTDCLQKIKCPTILIWGSKDKSTPLYMAKIMKKRIEDCGLIVFKNAGHFSYLEHHNEFLIIVKDFFE